MDYPIIIVLAVCNSRGSGDRYHLGLFSGQNPCRVRGGRARQHAAQLQLGLEGGELVEPHKRDKHLLEGVESARTSPRLFDSFDVLRLGDGRAEAVGRAEKADGADVVNEGVLPREGNIDADATFNKNRPVVMEAGERIFDASEVGSGDGVAADEVAEVHEARQALDHV